jgi:ribonuclease E
MTQPRRKRRRRRGGRERSGTAGTSAASSQAQPSPEGTPAGSSGAPDEGRTKPAGRKSRRRRGRGRREPGREESEVRSSEDLVRAPARRRPAALTRPPDGTTLEQVIGELQSDWGVPQHPQEFRITLRVADDKPRTGGAATVEELREERPPDPGAAEATPAATPQVRREKAPAAPRVEGAGTNEGSSRRVRRRKRSRRRSRGRSEN